MNFYEKPLNTLSEKEWEQICMRCGKCCMCKYSDGTVIHFSNYMCKFFDFKNGLCSCYHNRLEKTDSGCLKVDVALLEQHLELLPPSCAYRRLYEGRGLPPYHPLLTGNPNSVIEAEQTVSSLPVISESLREDALKALLKKAKHNHWNVRLVVLKALEIDCQHPLRWLESYPLPSI